MPEGLANVNAQKRMLYRHCYIPFLRHTHNLFIYSEFHILCKREAILTLKLRITTITQPLIGQ